MGRRAANYSISITKHCAERWWERTSLAPTEISRYLRDPRGRISDRPPNWAPLRRGTRRFLVVHDDQVCFLLERSQLRGYDYAAVTCVVREGSDLARWAKRQHVTGSSTLRRRITYTGGRPRGGCALALVTTTALIAAAAQAVHVFG